MLKIINLCKSFGKQKLFDGVTFNVNTRERIGLVGRNGHGKTTLLKVIMNEEQPDSGEVMIPKNYTVGYMTQALDFTGETLIDEACRGLQDHMAGDRWRAEKILFGLGFTAEDMNRKPAEFSGGFQVRISLAKVLIAEPNMLLLDEPTNYLDILSIRWLTGFLRGWPGEIILVTHDRSFMDSVITHTVGIHRKRARKIAGGTDKYYEQILRDEEVYEKTRLNDEKKRGEAEQFIRRFRAKARLAGLVQSRIKALQKQDRLDRLEKIKMLDFSFGYRDFPGKVLLTADSLAFSYVEGKPVVSDFSISIRKSDRIAVIGKNGRGKTTLLRLLSGELVPGGGTMSSHPETSVGYYVQTNTLKLNESLTVEEEIAATGCERQTARDISGAMLFSDDDALKRISVLSGGEKSRVLLGKIIASPANLLMLDEPTNHLDMESNDALLAAIDEFQGAVVIVTHNEMFLRTLANRFVVFQGAGIRIHEGSYDHFIEKIGWEEERQKSADRTAEPDRPNRKDVRKLRADILARRSRSMKPLESEMSSVEKRIQDLENGLDALNGEMIRASETGDGKEISRLSKGIHDTRAEIDSLFERLDCLINEHETLTAGFESELSLIPE
ncbi:MAG: ABC-F family ATP-binding cassette domain-containing protein [Spirochaetes bacterium]|nr:ABC-F family ATP-binding cassette domain-containing protein [Spirochaetota bacterium]